MMAGLKRYWGVYKLFLSNAFAEGLSFRVNFVLLILLDLVFYAVTFGSVAFLYDHVEFVGSWDRSAFMFFISFVLVIDHLHMTFVSENYWSFSEDVKRGNLDFYLIKPVHPMFIVFFRYIRTGTLFVFFVPWGALFYFGIQNGLQWWDFVLLLPLILMSFLLLVFTEIALSMSVFWVVESLGIQFLRMQLQQIARWPDLIFGSFAKRFFSFVVPVLLINSMPVHFILDGYQIHYILIEAAALVLVFCLAQYLWNLALRQYESASS